MPEPDPRTGRACICIISSILFLCIVAGGGCFLAYMTLPDSQTTILLPVLGFTLVCMPWIFWIVTVVYRIMSRAFGFRMVIGGLYGNNSIASKGTADGGGDGVAGVNNIDGAQILDVNVKSPSSSLKNDAKNGDIGQEKKIKRDGSSSSSSLNDMSVRSHESELPLALSMKS
ncbi:hypothetical protein PTKIN_Ptkin07bG0096900 [Pterospermum kingtungense]